MSKKKNPVICSLQKIAGCPTCPDRNICKKEENTYLSKRFEKGQRYPLHYGTGTEWFKYAGEIEVLEAEYFENPIKQENIFDSNLTLGKATIKYVGTKYYKNKTYKVDIIYAPKDEWSGEMYYIKLTTKRYFSLVHG
ncbi:MAG: hypothetical protein LBM69_00080 [Lachnospiraceae bacterium]|jgi:hypothetical protein|nr:hypothetical protein [Lachnospiraceae bacterium]